MKVFKKKVLKKVLPLVLALVLALSFTSTAFAETMPTTGISNPLGGTWVMNNIHYTPEGQEPFPPAGNEYTTKVIYLPADKVEKLEDAMLMESEVADFLRDQGATMITSGLAQTIAYTFGISITRVNGWATLGLTCLNLAQAWSNDIFKQGLVIAENSSPSGCAKYTVNYLPDLGIQIGTWSSWTGSWMPGCIPMKYSYMGWTSGDYHIGNYDFVTTDYGVY